MSYTTQMLGDFDADGAITVEDLSQFVIGLDDRDVAYELGPFTGDIPHVFLDLDQQFNIEDIVAFAMMWNWYSANNTLSFQHYVDNGEVIDVELASDSIVFDIPADLSAYQVQIQYQQELEMLLVHTLMVRQVQTLQLLLVQVLLELQLLKLKLMQQLLFSTLT